MRWLKNQEKAFLEAFDRHADALYRHCFFRVSDPEVARDIVSETFTKTWDYLVKGNTIENMRPFLYRTLNHLIIDEYRKKSADSLDALIDEQGVPESAFEELVQGSRDDFEFALDAQRVHTLLAQLPEQYREVVVMRYIDGLSPAEIAELVNESVNAISVRIHRGIALLSRQAKQQNL